MTLKNGVSGCAKDAIDLPMHIGLLTTSYPRHEEDVAGCFVRGFARSLAARGHHLDIIAPEARHPHTTPDHPNLSLRTVAYMRPRHWSATFYDAGVADNVRKTPRAWPGLATFPIALANRVHNTQTPWDALVSHWSLPCGLIGGLFRKRRPHVCIFHSADVHLMRRLPGRQRIAHTLSHQSSSLIFVAETHRREFLSWLNPAVRATTEPRTHTQAMGINSASLAPLHVPTHEKTGPARLVFMGRLVRVKGIRILFDACRPLSNIEIIIAGEGPERVALERQARAARLRVRFVGNVFRQQKTDLLHSADAFVYPSIVVEGKRSEGLPTALLEAAAARCPIICSQVGGIPTLFTHQQNAWLTNPGDVDGLRTAIERVLDDRNLAIRLGQQAQNIAREHDWQQVAQRFEHWLLPPVAQPSRAIKPPTKAARDVRPKVDAS